MNNNFDVNYANILLQECLCNYTQFIFKKSCGFRFSRIYDMTYVTAADVCRDIKSLYTDAEIYYKDVYDIKHKLEHNTELKIREMARTSLILPVSKSPDPIVYEMDLIFHTDREFSCACGEEKEEKSEEGSL
jgi:hypothetical protein